MLNLCNELKMLDIPDIEFIVNLRNVLHDEEFLSKSGETIMCFYCSSDEILETTDEYCNFSNQMKEKILKITPFVKYHEEITVWHCDDCGEIIGIKIGKEYYYTEYDNEEILEKYLQKYGYIDETMYIKKCFHCDGKVEETKEEISCKDCGRKLGYKYGEKWYIEK